MADITEAGVYRAKITSHSVATTKRGFPQFVADFAITEKYVQDPSEIAHFKAEGVLTGDDPTWVDYSAYDLTDRGYFVLFNDPDRFTEDTALLNCKQVEAAVNWSGASFAELNDGSHVGTEVLIRVDESTNLQYPGLKIEWLDRRDASPTREVAQLDKSTIASLDAKLKMGGRSKPKPKPAAAAAPPKAKPAPAPAAPATPAPAATAEAPASVDTTKVAAAAQAAEGMTKDQAWTHLLNNKGENGDDAAADSWIAACSEVGDEHSPMRDEDTFDPADWAKIAKIAVRDLGG